jgi:hypothetical protein
VPKDLSFAIKNHSDKPAHLSNFMDRAMDINPESIKESMDLAFKELMNNPKLKDMKKQLAAMAIASQTLVGNTQAAFAIDFS